MGARNGGRDITKNKDRWTGRPVLSRVVSGFVWLAPLALSLAISLTLVRIVPAPDPLVGKVLWWLALGVLNTGVLLLLQRLAKRLLPLSVLLRFSLLFPDEAPNRFGVALRSGSVKNLERWLRDPRNWTVGRSGARAYELVLVMVGALNAHDRGTRGHSERVRALTDLITKEMKLPTEDAERLRWAGLLHDIGKLSVAKEILNKTGKPTEGEWDALRRHPEAGARLAEPLLPWLGPFADSIIQHHERFDGTGYPYGLKGEDICRGARIVAVADSFEAMTAARAYSKPIGTAAARRQLEQGAGTQFDPEVVRAFLSLSVNSLRRTVGPAAWLAQFPILAGLIGGHAAESAVRVAVVTKATNAMAVIATGTAVSVGTVAAVPAEPAPVESTSATTITHRLSTSSPTRATSVVTRARQRTTATTAGSITVTRHGDPTAPSPSTTSAPTTPTRSPEPASKPATPSDPENKTSTTAKPSPTTTEKPKPSPTTTTDKPRPSPTTTEPSREEKSTDDRER